MKITVMITVGTVAALVLPVFAVVAEDVDVTIDGKPVADLIKQLRSENRGFQMRAAQSLTKASSNDYPKIVPLLIPLLKSERENDRFVAAQTLGEYGPVSRVATPDLLPLLEGTQYERNRAAASKALGQIFVNAAPSDEVEKVTQALMKVFKDGYSDVRREAVKACGMIGPAAKSCIPSLPMLFDDVAHHGKPVGGPSWPEMYMVHSAAAWTAGRMGPLSACHIDKLISMLHGDRDISTTVVWAIGEIGPVNDNIVPNLMNRLEKTIYGQYEGFAVGAQKYLVGDITEGTTQEYRDYCFNVLAKFGTKSAKAVPLMGRLLSEEGWNSPHRIRNSIGALKVIKAVGPEAKEALPVLENVAKFTRFSDQIPKDRIEQFKKEAQAALAAVKGQ